MKIAIACEDGKVASHFGYCKNFYLFDVDDKQITKRELIPNPGHKPGFLPNYLNDLGVNVIIAGGMGGSAVKIFNDKNIEVIIGVSGSPQNSIEEYIEGELKSTGSICHEHQHLEDDHK